MSSFFFFNDTATTEIYTLSLHDALPISTRGTSRGRAALRGRDADRQPAGPDLAGPRGQRSEEHTSELQSPCNLVCRLLLEKKKRRIVSYGSASPSRTKFYMRCEFHDIYR